MTATTRPHLPAPATLSLREAATELGVHYMTAYRYVRTGRLRATRDSGAWSVDPADVAALRGQPSAPVAGRGRTGRGARVPELVDRLVEGDEAGSWAIVQSVLAGGAPPAKLYTDVFIPAMQRIGDSWVDGTITVADEHCATAVMQRLVGRMGPLFRPRGRTRGIVVLGAPAGDLHSLPTALAADLLRGEGFVVIDLGANVPTDSFVDCVTRLPRVIAVGVAVTTTTRRAEAGRLLAALRHAGVTIPVILGGSGVDEETARRLGADHWADGAASLAHLLTHRSRGIA